MSNKLTFESVKISVEGSFPTPIATVFRKCRIGSRDDLGGRHKNLIDLFEVLVKFLCIVLLQEARQLIPNLQEVLPQREKTLEFLKRPSLGRWVGLLRILCNLQTGDRQPQWMNLISDYYTQPKNPANTEILGLLNQIEGIKFETRTKTPNAEICNALA